MWPGGHTLDCEVKGQTFSCGREAVYAFRPSKWNSKKHEKLKSQLGDALEFQVIKYMGEEFFFFFFLVGTENCHGNLEGI